MADLQALTENIGRQAAMAPRLGYRVKFALHEGGVILWDGTGPTPVISNEDAAADTTFRIAGSDLEQLLAGTLDPMLAYSTGRLKVEGSLGVAMKLGSLLGG
jgi:putative sterol carrier protein